MPIQILHSFSLFLNGNALLATIDKDMLYDYLVAIFVHKKIVGVKARGGGWEENVAWIANRS